MIDRLRRPALQATKWLRFERLPGLRHKRLHWEVWSLRHGYDMGFIFFYPRWRHYVFEPAKGTLYNKACLLDLAERLDQLNRFEREHRIIPDVRPDDL